MRALIVDPTFRTVREEDVSGSLESLQQIVGGYIEAIYLDHVTPTLAGHHAYLDEGGRLKPAVAAQRWRLEGWGEAWLCGPAVVLCDDGYGAEAPATASVAQLKSLVTFL